MVRERGRVTTEIATVVAGPGAAITLCVGERIQVDLLAVMVRFSVAVRDPRDILPPEECDTMCANQEPLGFPGTVFGPHRAPAGESIVLELTARYGRFVGEHRTNLVLAAD